MTCSENSCGTGVGSTILPGDPDNNSLLTAAPAFGGVEISWTLPSTNAHGVAYVRIYRGLTDSFASGLIIANASGDRYFDRFDWSTTVPSNLYYWIQFVSVNGTVGAPIGPASAVPRRTIDEVIQQLTAQIDYNMLSVELKSEVDKINLNKSLVDTLFTDVAAEQLSIRDVLMNLQSTVDETQVFLSSEIAARQDGVSALVASLNTLAASNETLQAAIQTEEQARVDADSALSSSITTAQTSLNNSIASVQTSLSTSISTTNSKVTALGALYTAKVTVNGLVGGFGVYNNGAAVDAGFDVDTFWVGRTQSDKKKPFIVSNNEVFINTAVIQTASIDIAKINKATIQSLSALNANMGTLTAGKIRFEQPGVPSNYMEIDSANQSLRVYNAGVLRVKIGNLS